MGRTYLFECPKCGYKAKVSGGADEGYRFAVQTILCRDCKAIYDAVTRLKAPGDSLAHAKPGALRSHGLNRKTADNAPTFENALNQLALPGNKATRWIRFQMRCPVSVTHRVQTWKDPGKCPRCGVFLERSALAFRIWD
jgi:hypothetical protein